MLFWVRCYFIGGIASNHEVESEALSKLFLLQSSQLWETLLPHPFSSSTTKKHLKWRRRWLWNTWQFPLMLVCKKKFATILLLKSVLWHFALEYVKFVTFDHQSSFILSNQIKVTLSFELTTQFIDFFFVLKLYGCFSLFLSLCLRFNLLRHFSSFLTSMACKS